MSGDAVRRLDEITRRLRRECPWDREQDERSIVPHTVEEAYELADAAESGDDTKLLDELGDVLFQVHFLALLLEERGAGSLDEVAEAMVQKLIRRHPHVFGPGRVASGEHDNPAGSGSEAEDPGGIRVDEVLAQWDRIKREQEGRAAEDPFEDVPENLPALLYARKMQRRAAAAGLGGVASGEQAIPAEADSRRIGDALFALVDEARRLRVDPELALRAASRRFRDEAASGERRPGDPGTPAN